MLAGQFQTQLEALMMSGFMREVFGVPMELTNPVVQRQTIQLMLMLTTPGLHRSRTARVFGIMPLKLVTAKNRPWAHTQSIINYIHRAITE